MVIFPESDHLVAILALLPSAAYSPSLGFRFLNCKMGMVIRPPHRVVMTVTRATIRKSREVCLAGGRGLGRVS